MVVHGDGFVVHVASVDDIIAAKTFANRDKDSEALHELIDIRERERSPLTEQSQSGPEAEINRNRDFGIEM